ncbi:MAG: LPD38 domain-containing protein [Pseudomonadota bacterium]
MAEPFQYALNPDTGEAFYWKQGQADWRPVQRAEDPQTRRNFVWHDGLSDWQAADWIPERPPDLPDAPAPSTEGFNPPRNRFLRPGQVEDQDFVERAVDATLRFADRNISPLFDDSSNVDADALIPPQTRTDMQRYEEKSTVEVTGERLELGVLRMVAGLDDQAALNAARALQSVQEARRVLQADPNFQAGVPLSLQQRLGPQAQRVAQAYVNLKTPGGLQSRPSITRALTDDESYAAFQAETIGTMLRAIEDAIETRREAGEIDRNPLVDVYMQAIDRYGWSSPEARAVFAEDPYGIIGQLSIESAPNMAPAIVGGLIFGPAGAAVGGFLPEYMISLSEGMRELGIDPNDAAAVRAALQDEEQRDQIASFAATRGITIATFDAISVGLIRAAVRKLPSAVSIPAGTVTEAATEGLGEAAAQLVTTGEVKESEVVAEILGATGPGVAQAALQSANEAIRAVEQKTRRPPDNSAPPEGSTDPLQPPSPQTPPETAEIPPLPQEESAPTLPPPAVTPPGDRRPQQIATEDAALLLGFGVDAEDVVMMNDAERAATLQQARSANVQPIGLGEAQRVLTEALERYRPDSLRLTEEDRASPIPNDVIDDGKRLQEEAIADANRRPTVPLLPPAQIDVPAQLGQINDLTPADSLGSNTSGTEAPTLRLTEKEQVPLSVTEPPSVTDNPLVLGQDPLSVQIAEIVERSDRRVRDRLAGRETTPPAPGPGLAALPPAAPVTARVQQQPTEATTPTTGTAELPPPPQPRPRARERADERLAASQGVDTPDVITPVAPVSTEQQEEQDPAAYEIEEFSEKSIILRGLPKAEAQRIGDEIGARPLWNRRGQGWIFSKKREAQVRQALGLQEEVGNSTPETETPVTDQVEEDVQSGVLRRVTTETGQEIEVEDVVVDASELSQAEGDLQARDRSRAQNEAWVAEKAGRIDPERLMPWVEADRGSPIVGPDGVIESGNGRVRLIERAARENPEGFTRYVEAIRARGFEIPEGVQTPVLIARRVTDLSDADRTTLTDSANMSATAAFSASERAKLDARTMSTSIMRRFRSEEPTTSAANTDAVRQFVAALPAAERAGLVSESGEITPDARRRAQRAMFSRAYRSSDIVEAALETDAPEIKGIIQAMTSAAPRWVEMSDELLVGDIEIDANPTDALLDALRLVQKARQDAADQNRPVAQVLAEALAQMDLLTGQGVPVEAAAFVRAMYLNDGLSRPRAAQRLASLLDDIAVEVISDAKAARGLEGRPSEPKALAPAIVDARERNDGASGNLFNTSPVEGAAPSRRSRNDKGSRNSGKRTRDRKAPNSPSKVEASGAPDTPQQDALPDLRARLTDIVGANVALRIDEELSALGRFEMTGENAVVILQSVADERTLNHEIIHALRNLGAFSDKEWRALSSRARGGWVKKHDIKARYPKADQALLEEEAIAEEYAAWAQDRSKAPAPVKALFGRIKQLVEATRNWVRGWGFQTSEDIFAAIEAGNMQPSARPGENVVRERRAGSGVPFDTYDQINVSAISRMYAPWNWGSLLNAQNSSDLKAIWRRTFVTSFGDARRQQEAIEAMRGEGLSIGQDVTTAQKLYFGKTGERLQKMHEDHAREILRAIRAADLSTDEVDNYLHALHAEERNAQVAKLYQLEDPEHQFVQAMSDPDLVGGSGMSRNEARSIIQDVESSEKSEAFKDVAGRVRAMLDEALDRQLEAGLISQDAYAGMKEAYRNYVPLRGVQNTDEASQGGGVGRGFDIRGQESKRATGRFSRSDSPLAFAFSQAANAIIRSEKNEVGKTFLRMVAGNPNDALWSINREESRRRVKSKVYVLEDPDTGLPIPVRAEQAVEEADPPMRFDDNVLIVKVGGEEVYITLENRDLAAAMKNLNAESMSSFMRALNRLTRTMAALNTTWNIEWFATNIVRDLQTAGIQVSDENLAGLQKNMFKNLAGAAKGAFQYASGTGNSEWKRVAEDFAMNGGKVSFIDFKGVEEFRDMMIRETSRTTGSAIRRIAAWGPRNLLDGIDIITTSGENMIRIAAYKAAVDLGLPKQRSAKIARDLTVDFNQKGTASASINAWFMFFNAAVQGNVRLIKSLAKSRFTQGSAMALVGLGVAEVLFASMTGEADEYEKLSDWERQRNFIIMGPGGEYAKVPMPYGFNVFKVVGTEMARAMTAREHTPMMASANILVAAVTAFNPLSSMYPSTLAPVAEVAQNENFFGNQIAPTRFDRNDPKPNNQNYFPSVNPTMRDFTAWLNDFTGGNQYRSGYVDINPEHLDHLLTAYTGGVGRLITRSQETGEALLTGAPLETNRVPFLRNFYGHTLGEMPTWRTYDRLQERANALRYEVENQRKDGNPDAALEALAADPVMAKLYPYFRAREKLLARMRRAMNTLRQRGSDEQKIIDLRNRITAAQQEAIERYYKIRDAR